MSQRSVFAVSRSPCPAHTLIIMVHRGSLGGSIKWQLLQDPIASTYSNGNILVTTADVLKSSFPYVLLTYNITSGEESCSMRVCWLQLLILVYQSLASPRFTTHTRESQVTGVVNYWVGYLTFWHLGWMVPTDFTDYLRLVKWIWPIVHAVYTISTACCLNSH